MSKLQITYINLEHRVDRKSEFISQFNDISDQVQLNRFNAINKSPGYLGCTLSHIECIKNAIENKLDYLILCEDDFELTVSPSVFIERIKSALNYDWDTLVLTGFLRESSGNTENNMARITNIQTTTGYIVRSHYFKTLLNNFQDGYANLVKYPHLYSTYGLDQYWKNLQKIDKWYVSSPLLGKQRVGYSDIELKNINYDNYFVNSEHNRKLVHK